MDSSLRAEVAALVEAKLEELGKSLDGRLETVEAGLATNNRLRNLALATAIVCMVAAGFSAGYALTSREQLKDTKRQLADQIATNRKVVCSSAQSVALAFREPQVSSDGTKEPTAHFVNRMLAQRVTLKLAGPLHCQTVKGFASFPFLRAKALYEIERALHKAEPDRFPKPKTANPSTTLPKRVHEELAQPAATAHRTSPQASASPIEEPTASTTHEGDLPPPEESSNPPAHEQEHHPSSGGQEEGHERHEPTERSGGSEGKSGESSASSSESGQKTEEVTGGPPTSTTPTPTPEEPAAETPPPPPHRVAGIEVLPEEGAPVQAEVEVVEPVQVCTPLVKLNCRE